MGASRRRTLPLPSPLQLDDLWRQRIGEETPRATWVDQQSKARRLREQTEDLARRLEGLGIEARDERDLTLVGLCTGKTERLQAWRNINFLPAIQARNKRELLRSVAYWMDVVPQNQRRMWVVSWGWVPLLELRNAAKAMGRALSKMAADDDLSGAGIEIVFRGTEFPMKRDEHGEMFVHLHAHLLLRTRRFLGSKPWKALLDTMKDRYIPKGYLNDGPIREASEVVKYVFKPEDLADLGDAELVALFEQTRGLHLHQPMRELRELRQVLDTEGLRLIRIGARKKGDDRGQWAVVHRSAGEKRERADDAEPATADVVMAVTMPQPRFDVRAEPCLVVLGYGGDLERLIKVNGLAKRRAFAVALYAAHHDDNCPGGGADPPMRPPRPTDLVEPTGREAYYRGAEPLAG